MKKGGRKSKSVAIETHGNFNFKSSENVNDRHVFEKLCLDTSLRGFSYDPDLLVDLDKVSSFDEACIRITTKCGSIVTQLSSVGHNVTHFGVTAATTATGSLTSPKTPTVPKIPESPVSLISSQMPPSSLYFMNSQTSPLLSPSSLAKPKFHGFDNKDHDNLAPQDHRNIRVMGELWGGLKKKNYTGMIAVARVTSTSIPSNNSKDHYSIKALTDTLLSNIKGYFMFQNFSSTFDKDFDNSGVNNNGKNNNREPGGEYLLYVVYRSKPAVKETKKDATKPKSSEAEKLSSPWSTYISGSTRKLRHESGDSAVSSCSSISSTTSGGPCGFSAPSGKAANLRLEMPQDTLTASLNKKNTFSNTQSYSTPQTLTSPPTSQGRKLITPPSPSSPKASSFQVVKGQKLFSQKPQPAQSSLKSPTYSQRNLRHQPYKQQQDNNSSNVVANDTVSKAITVAIASLSQKVQNQKAQPQNQKAQLQNQKAQLQNQKAQLQNQKAQPHNQKAQPQNQKVEPPSLFANQLKQQQQKITQLAKITPQVQRHQPARLQQQKSQETTVKPAFKSLPTKTVSTTQRVPITAPKPAGPTTNLRSSPAVPVAISQRTLRHSFTKK